MNRHEIISHFYSKDGLNEEGQNILEALQFNSYPEALIWIAHEFTQIKLDWRNIGGGSPYPASLPNVVKQIEIGSNSKLEDVLISKWNELTDNERLLVNQNFKDIFGFPELAQGFNNTYCKDKYKNWVSLNQNE